MTDNDIAELAKRTGLHETYSKYPALVRAAVERGLTANTATATTREPTTEPAHLFVVTRHYGA
jgi:Arc/MetJ family transcription regulator